MMATSTSSVSASSTTFSSQHSLSSAASLGEDRRMLQRLFTDFVIYVLLIIPIIVCEFGIEPFRRGFFCDDETIRYPFKDNTVTTVMLGLLVGVLPAIMLIIVELICCYQRNQMAEMIFILRWKIPTWILECSRQIAFYSIGLTLTFDATEVAKYTIGRLRPHFIAVCQPQFKDDSTCEDVRNQHRYVEDYDCVADGFTALDVLEARRSFPSGHSSLAFYAMVYIAIYIQHRFSMKSSKLARHFLQFIAVMIAWFTALSRIIDNWHHWSDVLAGTLIGILGALLTARFIAKLHQKRSLTSLLLTRQDNTKITKSHVTNMKVNIPRQDTLATLDEVISTPPPYMLSTASSYNNEQYCTKV